MIREDMPDALARAEARVKLVQRGLAPDAERPGLRERLRRVLTVLRSGMPK